MAKLSSSARTPSRAGKADTHPATAPQRTVRSTRSQSRETSVQPGDERPPSSGGAPKKRAARKRQQNDLTAVPETVDEEELQAQAAAAEEEAAAAAAAALADSDDGLEPRRRESAHSAMTGTTAKTSFSQEEIASLDAEVMVDVLPDLAKSAEQMCSLLVPQDPEKRPVVWKEIRSAGSRQSKLFHNRLESLRVHKHSFGSQEYIQPTNVVRAFLGVQTMDDVPDAPWRPDDIVYKINLAQMLRTVLITVYDAVELTDDSFEALQSLETYFPATIADTQYDPEAVNLCLALQQQVAIARLHIFRLAPNFQPNQVINGTFFEEDSDQLVPKILDALHVPADTPDAQQWTALAEEYALYMRSRFNQGSIEAALAQLRGKYPWHRLVDQVLHYYEHRNTQLNGNMFIVGGLNTMMSSLMAEVERREDAKRADEKRKSFGGTATTPKKSFGKGAIAALKAREQRRLSSTAPPTAITQPAPQVPVAQMMDPRLSQQQPQGASGEHDDSMLPPEDDHSAEQPTAQQRAITALELSGFQNQQRQNVKKGKARAFIDPQENAVRINFDDSQPSQQYMPGDGAQFQMPGRSSAPGPYHNTSSSRSPEKRTHAQANDEPQDFEPTQDEGFETNQRDPARADARREAVPVPQRRQHTQPAPAASSSNTVNYEIPSSAGPQDSPSKRRRKNPGSPIPSLMPLDENEGPLPAGSYEQAKVFAKQARITASQNKPPQVRTPWSRAEDNALISLIENHGDEGISYAALKKHADHEMPGVLDRRSAEDLRFKARNMKMTWLLARMNLPENWEHVVLDKKAIDKLHDREIPYHQQRIRAVNEDAPGA